MKPEHEELMQRAENRLSAARLLADNGNNLDAANRVYYAIFHAAKALLHKKGSNPKTHEGTASELGKLYRDELGKDMTRFFSQAQSKREAADYGETSKISGEEIRKDINQAENFISKARKVLS
jgi:uncharacterized protein (UPF0332 family)